MILPSLSPLLSWGEKGRRGRSTETVWGSYCQAWNWKVLLLPMYHWADSRSHSTAWEAGQCSFSVCTGIGKRLASALPVSTVAVLHGVPHLASLQLSGGVIMLESTNNLLDYFFLVSIMNFPEVFTLHCASPGSPP